jgi:flagellar biosynthetic protein FlhB
MAGERTEKATPKKRNQAQKDGKVARSMDFHSAAVLMAALVALGSFGPKMLAHMQESMVTLLALVSKPQVVDSKGLGELFTYVLREIALTAGPVVAVCAIVGVAVNVLMVGLKPAPGVLKPKFSKLNPISGFKSLFSPNSLVELAKNLFKIAMVATVVALALLPKLDTLGAMVGTPGPDLLPILAHQVLSIAQRAALLYLAMGAADVFYQRYRFEKSLKMDKQEVKDEHKQTELPAEVKRAQRRKAFELASARMMDAVPTADVVVVNPTHYSVALKYSSDAPAPIVVAKGLDNLAFKIRELAREADVAIVPDPPLARSLYGSVEVGKMIPEELFHAVAQLLAYVYRVAGARKAAVAA